MFVKQDDEQTDGQTMAAVMNDEGPSKQTPPNVIN